MQGEINEWLFRIKFHQFLSKEFTHVGVIDDPIRNGLFFADLVSFLEKVDFVGINLKPKTLQECKTNLEQVISIIRQRRANFPS